MTFLDLVNKVMVRLRETEVTSVSGSAYTKLIAALINDSKRVVEDACPWTGLLNTVEITTSSGVADYSLTDTNERTTVNDVVNTTNNGPLVRSKARDLIRLKLLETGNNTPGQWGIIGLDSSGQLKARVYPTPSGAFDLSFNCVIPDDDLSAATDSINVPAEPIYLRALALAIRERGEDGGLSYNEAWGNYKQSLSRFMILNNSAAGGSGSWAVR